MTLRLLIGPAVSNWTSRHFGSLLSTGLAQAFSYHATSTLGVRLDDNWARFAERFPQGWQPDALVLLPSEGPIPSWLFEAPVPVIGISWDWKRTWHRSLALLRRCDLVISDRAGSQHLKLAGLSRVEPASLFSPTPLSATASSSLEGDRNIDVLVAIDRYGPLAVAQADYLRRLVLLGKRLRVRVVDLHEAVNTPNLLQDAKVVLPLTDRPQSMEGVLHATASGALLALTRETTELCSELHADHDYVPLADRGLEDQLASLLANDNNRQEHVRAAQTRLASFRPDSVGETLVHAIDAFVQKGAAPARPRSTFTLADRLWQVEDFGAGSDPSLGRELANSLAQTPNDGVMHHALGLYNVAQMGQTPDHAAIEQCIEHFKRSFHCDQALVCAGLGVADLALTLNRMDDAAKWARFALGALEISPAQVKWSPVFLQEPLFRYLWEQAGWTNAGRDGQEAEAKISLLRWRLHIILAEATGDVDHYFEAALAAPDVSTAQGALGCALARTGKPFLALSHLRKALRLDPFDLPALRALYHALGEVEQPKIQEALAEDLEHWHRAAPPFFPDRTWLQPPASLPGQFQVASGSPQPPIHQAAADTAKAPPASVPSGIRKGVTLCMIVRNEEHNLADCLGSVYDLVDELIVVDTGSTDRTKEIADQFGARVFDFPWCDDFAAARNESLRHATREWLFWMDADDRLDDANRQKLRDLFKSLPEENVGFVMKCLCLPDHVHGIATEVDHVRLFRNQPNIRWRYRVHEQILLSIRESGGEIRWADVAIHHTGYQDPTRRPSKLQRDLRLLQLDHAANPDEPFILFNLGWTNFELQQYEDAIRHLEQSLARSAPADSIVRKIFALLVQSHRALNQTDRALSRCREGRLLFPEDDELLFHEGLLLSEKGDLAGAETCFLQLLPERPRGYFASVDPALRGFLPRYHLGELCLRTARPREAEQWWRASLEQRTDFVPAALGLADIFLAENRQDDLEKVLDALSRDPRAANDVLVLRGRNHLLSQERDRAIELFRTAVEKEKAAFAPRFWLAKALIEQGAIDAAERVIQEALLLRPEHEAAKSLFASIQQRKSGS